jgi:hypothetical protein
MSITNENKQALKKCCSVKIAITTANFILVQIFIKGLKPDIKNKMIKQSWTSLEQVFEKTKELEKLAKQKAISSTKIN